MAFDMFEENMKYTEDQEACVLRFLTRVYTEIHDDQIKKSNKEIYKNVRIADKN
mgnify:CR=1 FL=1